MSLRIRNIKSKKEYSVSELFEQIRKRSSDALGRAITLIESQNKKDQDQAHELINKCLPYTGNSIRVGITGVPGVGKSTFIEAFGEYLISKGHKVAVLAVDPSSQQTKGSILGDKTRMEVLSSNENAFIRPSASGDSLGGVAAKTRESILLCEAAGYDIILVETVGVGQSETAVHSMTDFFLLLMLAGAGDELQGIKKGIMEMADLLVINKADQGNEQKAKKAAQHYKSALHLFPLKASNWTAQVNTCSALEKKGMDEILTTIESFKNAAINNGYFHFNRKEQAKYWLNENINEQLKQDFFSHKEVRNLLSKITEQVLSGEISPYTGSQQLLNKYKQ